MILLTRFPNGDQIALNPDLIERAEQNPDSVITMSNGTHYVVHETVEQLIEIVQRYRAQVLALAQLLADHHGGAEPAPLRLVHPARPVALDHPHASDTPTAP